MLDLLVREICVSVMLMCLCEARRCVCMHLREDCYYCCWNVIRLLGQLYGLVLCHLS